MKIIGMLDKILYSVFYYIFIKMKYIFINRNFLLKYFKLELLEVFLKENFKIFVCKVCLKD